jgi:hypothetical protein
LWWFVYSFLWTIIFYFSKKKKKPRLRRTWARWDGLFIHSFVHNNFFYLKNNWINCLWNPTFVFGFTRLGPNTNKVTHCLWIH